MTNVITLPLTPARLRPFDTLWALDNARRSCNGACASAHEALSKLGMVLGLSPVELMQQHAPEVLAVLQGAAKEEERHAEEWAAARELAYSAEHFEQSQNGRL
jgi:hypothetical protein